MPLTRYQLRNEYGLAEPEMYRAVETDDSEALLEGVAMAGLVGVLRQLGDLAEFAAAMFHDLHEEVMVTAARGNALMLRVQQLEAEFPFIETEIVSQTDHSLFFSNAGVDWHPNLRMQSNLITQGDLPRFVRDSYEECQGPPRLFLLDKFDVAGAGACLKRYTNPSLYKNQTASSEMASGYIRREKKSRKMKNNGPQWRDGWTPDMAPISHAKLHQLLSDERVESDYTDPGCLVKLKRRELYGSPHDSNSGRSYMEKFLQSPSSQLRTVPGTSSNPPFSTLCIDTSRGSGSGISEISVASAVEKSYQQNETEVLLGYAQERVHAPTMNLISGKVMDKDIEMMPEQTAGDGSDSISSSSHKTNVEEILLTNENGRKEIFLDDIYSEDVRGGVGKHMHGYATMESDTEMDSECAHRTEVGFVNVRKHRPEADANEEQTDTHLLSDAQSIQGTSVLDDSYTSYNKRRSHLSDSDNIIASAENDCRDVEEAAKLVPPTQTTEAEIEVESFDQPTVDKECIKLVSVGKDKDSISELKEASCSSQHKNKDPVISPKTRSSLQEVSSVSCRLHEAPQSVDVGTEKLSTNEIEMSLIDNSKVYDVHSEVKDDANPTAASVIHLEDELGGGDSHVSSNALLNPKLPDMAPEETGSMYESSVNEVPQIHNAEDIHSDNLPNGGIDSLQPLVSSVNESSHGSATQGIEACRSMSSLPVGSEAVMTYKVDDLISEAQMDSSENGPRQYAEAGSILAPKVTTEFDDSAVVAELVSEDVPRAGTEAACAVTDKDNFIFENQTSKDAEIDDGCQPNKLLSSSTSQVIGSSEACSQSGKQSSDISHEDSPEEANAKQIGPYSEEEATEQISSATGYSEDEGISYKDNLADGYSIPVEGPSDHLDNPESCEETVHEDFDISHLKVAYAGNSEISSGDQSQEGTGFQGDFSPEYHLGEEEQKQNNSMENASTDSEIVASVSVSCDHCSLDVLVDDQNSSIGEPTGNNLTDANVTSPSSSSKLSMSESETIYPDQSNLSQNTDDAVSSAACLLSEHVDSLERSLHLHAHQLERQQANKARSEPERCLNVLSESGSEGSSLIGEVLESSPQVSSEELHISKQAMNSDPILPSFGLLSQATLASLEASPPLPPLPPAQWLGKAQSAASASQTEPTVTTVAPSIEAKPSVGDGYAQSDFTASNKMSSWAGNSTLTIMPTMVNKTYDQHGSVAFTEVESENSSNEHSSNVELVQTPNKQGPDKSLRSKISEDISGDLGEHPELCCVTTAKLSQPNKVEELSELVLHGPEGQEAQGLQCSTNVLSSSTNGTNRPIEVQNANENPKFKPSQGFLVDVAAALDRSKLKKVSDRALPPLEAKVDEMDSLLEQIRNKSFNLKPAALSKPSIHQAGPITNLKIAAILEKANTIRQAIAGMEEDDSDTWSDS